MGSKAKQENLQISFFLSWLLTSADQSLSPGDSCNSFDNSCGFTYLFSSIQEAVFQNSSKSVSISAIGTIHLKALGEMQATVCGKSQMERSRSIPPCCNYLGYKLVPITQTSLTL